MEKIAFRFRLEYWGYSLFEKVIGAIPERMLPRVASALAWFIFHVVRIRREVTLQNLAIAFPEKSHKWRKKVGYRSYRHFVLVISEFFKMARWSAEHLNDIVLQADIESFLQDYRQGKGAVVVSGHFGNWEVGVGYLHLRRVESAVIQQRQKNPLVDAHMRRLRERWGMKVIYTRGAVLNSIKQLRQGRMVALLGDQDAGSRGVFVPFFGRPSSTHVGAAILTLKTEAPLYFASCLRVGEAKYRIRMEKIPIPRKWLGKKEHVQEITVAFTAKLEEWVRRYPEQYFWMHRRWKTSLPKDHPEPVN